MVRVSQFQIFRSSEARRRSGGERGGSPWAQAPSGENWGGVSELLKTIALMRVYSIVHLLHPILGLL